MKKIIMLLSVFFLCFSLFLTTSYCYSASSIPDAENTSMSEHYSGQFVPYVEDDVVVRMDNSGITLIGKNNPVFKQDDIDTNFVNYASGESRNTLPNVYTGIDSEVSNVVGVVLEFETDEPIGEAIVSANGNDIVVTDIDGRFQITNMPDGVYDWTIQADGYQDGIYENYVVTSAGGTNIYRFYLSKDMEYINPFEEYTGQSLENGPDDAIAPYSVTHPNPTMTSVPNAYDEVKALVNGVIKTYDRDEYIWYTINAEQYLPINT